MKKKCNYLYFLPFKIIFIFFKVTLKGLTRRKTSSGFSSISSISSAGVSAVVSAAVSAAVSAVSAVVSARFFYNRI